MSLSSILHHINKKGQVQKRSVDSNTSSGPNVKSSERSSHSSMSAMKGTKQVDPVVAMLKEKRRSEKEKKELELREKKGLSSTKPKPAARSAPKTARSKVASNSKGPGSVPARNVAQYPQVNQVQRSTAKKLNFNELIKKASKIDNSKLSISIRPKTKSPEVANSNVQKKPVAPIRRPTNIPQASSGRSQYNESVAKTVKPVTRIPETSMKNRAPIPTRKPSAQLEAKLKKKSASLKNNRNNMYENAYEDEYDEEDNSFIVSDDEVVDDPVDYDRDEIWAIFNKGKKRSYFDRYDGYVSDDMEATGNEILEEEMRSKRRAELEDRKEQEMERKLQEQKRARKLKMFNS